MAVELCGEAVSQEADRQGEGGNWVGVILGSSIWEITVKFLVSRYKVKAGRRDDRVSPCQTSCHIIRSICCLQSLQHCENYNIKCMSLKANPVSLCNTSMLLYNPTPMPVRAVTFSDIKFDQI